MIFEKIRDIIAEKLDMRAEDILESSSFTDMKADSLYMVEIMLSIEDAFDITIDDASNLETVSDLCKYVENKTK